MFKYVLAAAISLASINGSYAAVIGNGAPNDSGGTDMNGALPADRFSLSTASFLTSLTYWSLQTSSADYAGTTTVDIFADAGTTPGALLFSVSKPFAALSAGASSLGYQIFMNTASLSGPLFAAGNYWLGLHNGPVSTIPANEYYWDWSADSGASRYQDLTTGSSAWVQNDASLAFLITTATPAAVPEPGELALAGIGLFAAGLLRRRRSAGARATASREE